MRFILPEQKKLTHEMTMPIRWGDMDAMGHVNNTLYFRYMEVIRLEWLFKIGAGPDPSGFGPVIVNAFCNFIRQLEFPGEVLARQPKQDDGTVDIAVARAVHAYKKRHPYASAVELDEVRARARAKQGVKSVPYFDETVSMVKSASVLHASYRVGAMLERAAGRTQQAAVLISARMPSRVH